MLEASPPDEDNFDIESRRSKAKAPEVSDLADHQPPITLEVKQATLDVRQPPLEESCPNAETLFHDEPIVTTLPTHENQAVPERGISKETFSSNKFQDGNPEEELKN